MTKVERGRGFRAERELVRKLWKMGFAAIRGPASGAKVKKSVYPDVVAIRNGLVLVFEVKYRRKPDTIYIPRHQVEKIVEFARRASGVPLIAVRIGELKEWKVIQISELETYRDMYRITQTMIHQSPSLEDFIQMLRNRKNVDPFKQK